MKSKGKPKGKVDMFKPFDVSVTFGQGHVDSFIGEGVEKLAQFLNENKIPKEAVIPLGIVAHGGECLGKIHLLIDTDKEIPRHLRCDITL